MKRSLRTKLRVRFVLFAMLGLLLMQSVITGVSIYHNYRDLVTKSDMLISQLYNNPSGASRYFSVKIPAGKDTVYPDAVQHVSITAEQATTLTRQVLEKNRSKGFVDGYRYHIYQNESGTKIYFLLRDSGIEMCKTAAENMIWISLIGLAVIGTALIPVSAWVVKPLIDNHNKQKQFITSASHELKTPLTVISANAQLLESEIGENQWIDSILQQVEHLMLMTCDLVTLSKAEEEESPLLRERFPFSDTVTELVELYQDIARQNAVELKWEVPQNMIYNGSQKQMRQLLQILLDNGCKYCPREGEIRVSAEKLRQGIKLRVCNTILPMEEEDGELLTQRFYRGKNAGHTNGFGLGLSIAESIVHRHNGTMTVSAKKEQFCVDVTLR